MTVTEVKHQAKAAEWKEKILRCRSSGIPVKHWCRENGVSDVTYYRWERELFGRIKGREIKDMVPVEPIKENPAFVELAPPAQMVAKDSPETVIATIRYGAVSIDIRSSANPSFIVSLCKELQYA